LKLAAVGSELNISAVMGGKGHKSILQVRHEKHRDGGHIANKKGRTPKLPSGLLDRPAYVLGFLAVAAVRAMRLARPLIATKPSLVDRQSAGSCRSSRRTSRRTDNTRLSDSCSPAQSE
jgi:hypothetical protein